METPPSHLIRSQTTRFKTFREMPITATPRVGKQLDNYARRTRPMKKIALFCALTLIASSAVVASADAQGLSYGQAQHAASTDARTVCAGLEGCTSYNAGPCKRASLRKFACRVNWRIELEEPYLCERGICESFEEAYRCAGTDNVYFHHGRIRVAFVRSSTVCWES